MAEAHGNCCSDNALYKNGLLLLLLLLLLPAGKVAPPSVFIKMTAKYVKEST